MYLSGPRGPIPDVYSEVQRTPAAVILKQHLTLRGEQRSTRTAASSPQAKTDIDIETALPQYYLGERRVRPRRGSEEPAIPSHPAIIIPIHPSHPHHPTIAPPCAAQKVSPSRSARRVRSRGSRGAGRAAIVYTEGAALLTTTANGSFPRGSGGQQPVAADFSPRLPVPLVFSPPSRTSFSPVRFSGHILCSSSQVSPPRSPLASRESSAAF
jgi:hypothetical protein